MKDQSTVNYNNCEFQQAPEGSQAEVGDLIAIIVERDFDLAKIVVPSVLKAGAAAPAPAAAKPAASAPAAGAPSGATDKTPPSGQ